MVPGYRDSNGNFTGLSHDPLSEFQHSLLLQPPAIVVTIKKYELFVIILLHLQSTFQTSPLTEDDINVKKTNVVQVLGHREYGVQIYPDWLIRVQSLICIEDYGNRELEQVWKEFEKDFGFMLKMGPKFQWIFFAELQKMTKLIDPELAKKMFDDDKENTILKCIILYMSINDAMGQFPSENDDQIAVIIIIIYKYI